MSRRVTAPTALRSVARITYVPGSATALLSFASVGSIGGAIENVPLGFRRGARGFELRFTSGHEIFVLSRYRRAAPFAAEGLTARVAKFPRLPA